MIPRPLHARPDRLHRHPIILGHILLAVACVHRVRDGFDDPVPLVDAGNTADVALPAGRQPGVDRVRHGYHADRMGMRTYRYSAGPSSPRFPVSTAGRVGVVNEISATSEPTAPSPSSRYWALKFTRRSSPS